MRMNRVAQNACPGAHMHTPHREGAAVRLRCSSGCISGSRLAPRPTPEGEKENDRIEGLEQSTQFLLLGGSA